MNLAKQTGGVERHVGVVATDVAVGVGPGISPQLRGRLGREEALCYYRCVLAGAPDLVCRFFCGLRPFTIGGLLIAK